ncbi:MAG: insulinase family protein [Clostridia bacterium]|nr:insulinase family protein [Clostridia bacterium]
MLQNSIELSNSAQGFFIETDRFKTTLISYNFYLPLDKTKVAEFALLPFVLTTCGREYPDFSRLNFKLSKLYSASLSASAEKVGDYHLLKIGIQVLDDKYALDGEELVNSATKLLNSLIFEPRTENKAFFFEDVEREKRKAIEHIRGEMSEKRLYARKRLIEEMFKDDVFGLPKCGSEEQVAAITPESLYSAWEEMLRRAYLRINVISNTLPQGIFEDVKERLSLLDRSLAVKVEPSRQIKPIYAAQRIEEKMDVAQGKLVMGFSAQVGETDEDSAPFTVMCDIFGGGPYSRLFTNVREKMSLCYYCSANGDKRKGFLMVDSGVEAANTKKAEIKILRQLETVKSGKFTDFEFESSKRSIINSLKGYADHQDAIDAWYTVRCDANLPISPETYAEIIDSVDENAVTQAAKSVKLHTVYNLQPNGEK